jgi:hypothetical protein
VNVTLKALDGIGRVLVKVVCQNDRVHGMLDKVVKIFIGGNVNSQTVNCLFAARLMMVTNGNDLCTQQKTASRKIDASAGSKYANSDIFHNVLL